MIIIKQQKPAGGVAVLPMKEKEPKEKEQKPTKDEALNGKQTREKKINQIDTQNEITFPHPAHAQQASKRKIQTNRWINQRRRPSRRVMRREASSNVYVDSLMIMHDCRI